MDLKKLEERRQLAEQRVQQWQGEKTRLDGIKRGEERKQDTRRKIWVGGYFLNKMREDAALRQSFIEHLRTLKFRGNDRELFREFLQQDAGPVEDA